MTGREEPDPHIKPVENNISITNCYVYCKDDINPISYKAEGGIDFVLDGYAIIPLEEYEELKAIAAKLPIHESKYVLDVDEIEAAIKGAYIWERIQRNFDPDRAVKATRAMREQA